MATGTVKEYNPDKGWGYIALADGSGDVYVHCSQIQVEGRRVLTIGQLVEFEVSHGPVGRQARMVRPL
ncbi:cold shock protein (beta-ribbon, CspA family) [Streptoalloteichus tenebrarius]|uniref:Cold shock protein (Beta-ribbon, CspA family) n=1 Tax=Streptoalloteichus tenebrarius (strain ATCC 17920 / DSM 40477 / JCM 4838 / CBS 697.72 / NBRC 16177 / NCIMB 11028 / NRRL B-12390 / A12253. 1 / ISP 5477) TaxID=1933 RepID=A0ABT1I0D8_STRSD|nr:cold shock domain-containing protein [Streptoalloteichus tenebrarius]MCP2261196.1 cold shock protein (beta-ribbon, CspA family) [Streptoalloteichus tenebrarius]BFF02943.1 cold-shock protein [Streptoalloteichus tenebrarius]